MHSGMVGGSVSGEKGWPQPILLPVPVSTLCLRSPLSWGGACGTGGFQEPQSCSVALRVEEVNWASWEQTLPSLCEEPSGPAVPGE